MPTSRCSSSTEGPGVRLAPASPDDAPLFAAAEQEPGNREYVMPYSREEHLSKMRDPDVIYRRILRDDALAGFLILALEPDGTSVEFRRIVVFEKDRGVGQAALVAMESFCRDELRRSRIWLDVFEANTRGLHLYEKLGYRQFDARDYHGRRLLLYQKSLGGSEATVRDVAARP